MKVNTLSAPESFDDYEYNIVDLSFDEIWKYSGSSVQSIDCLNDIKIISAMIKTTKNKVLIILPQNVKYKYNYNPYASPERKYAASCELKNKIELLETIFEVITGTQRNTLLMYNKTKSSICGNELSCDFVFTGFPNEQSVTFSTTGTSVTTILYGNTYFTTLKLESERDILAIMQELKWLGQADDLPDWINDIVFFDDKLLNETKQSKSEELDKLQNDIKHIDEKLIGNREYKTVLCKSGEPLVAIVNRMLSEMIGYDYEEFIDKKEEDFLLQYNNQYFIGEIKGISTNVKRSNILQAATHKSIYLEIEGNENKDVHAIAIINRQRNLPPTERDDISSDVVKLAQLNDVLLIPTEIFLQLFEKFKAGEYSTEDVVKLLTNNKGLLQIKNEN